MRDRKGGLHVHELSRREGRYAGGIISEDGTAAEVELAYVHMSVGGQKVHALGQVVLTSRAGGPHVLQRSSTVLEDCVYRGLAASRRHRRAGKTSSWRGNIAMSRGDSNQAGDNSERVLHDENFEKLSGSERWNRGWRK